MQAPAKAVALGLLASPQTSHLRHAATGHGPWTTRSRAQTVCLDTDARAQIRVSKYPASWAPTHWARSTVALLAPLALPVPLEQVRGRRAELAPTPLVLFLPTLLADVPCLTLLAAVQRTVLSD